jgi:very-short-patch-repair endonuclease
VIDRDVMQLAALQFGAIGTHQLTAELGHSMRSISRARRRGVLLDVAPGVVRLASHPETFLMRCAAVQLHTRGIGFLSGWSAARLIGLRKMPRDPIHYTVPPSHRRTPPAWVELHVTSWYDPIDDRSAGPHDLTIASPMRMLWGLAAAFNQHRFERAAEDAWHLKLITPSAAADYLERHRCRGKDGVRRIESWLERATSQSAPSQSELERDLLDALARAGLPTPRRQHPLTLASGGVIHLDIAWPAALLAVEPGAGWWHGGGARARRDQARDRACTELGWHVVRFDETVVDDLDGAARQVARIHDRLAASGKVADSGRQAS